MQRLEAAHQGNMQPLVASAKEFKDKKDKLVHEANIVAAIAEVLLQEEMEDSADEGYAAHAKQMKQSAAEVVEAVKLDNYETAAKAVGSIGQACTQCHADFR
jgi:cytochrome c556